MKYAFCLTALIVVTGCGGVDDNLPRTVDAGGIVTVDGVPLEGASIVFMQDSGTHFARGMSDSDGRFSLDAFEQKTGAVPGDYNVTVSKTVTVEMATPAKIPKGLEDEAEHAGEGEPEQANASWVNDLPAMYNSPLTSGLKVTIPEDGKTDIELTLVR